MSERKDERWLDDQLQRAINGGAPEFDARAWQRKYANEYEALVARSKQVGWGLPHRKAWILRASFAKVAIAAAVIVGVGVLLTGRFGNKPPTTDPQPVVQMSPARMVSMISLSAAFRTGGMERLDKQCDRACETLGPRPSAVPSVQELLKEINGKG